MAARIRVVTALFLLATGAIAAEEPPRAVLGFGGLSLGFDASGWIAALSWPGPGHYAQLNPSPWRRRIDQLPYGMGLCRYDGRWRVAQLANVGYQHDFSSVASESVDGALPRVVWSLEPHRSLLRARIDAPGEEPAPGDLAFVLHFGPAANPLPESAPWPYLRAPLHGAVWEADLRTSTVYAYRPAVLDAETWLLLSNQPAAPTAPRLPSGTWVGARSTAADVRPFVAPSGALLPPPRGLAPTRLVDIGAAYFGFLLPETLTEAVDVAIAFGPSKADVDRNLDQGVPAPSVDVAGVPLADSPITAYAGLDTHLLRAAQDTATGAVVGGYPGGNSSRVVDARSTAWAVLAYLVLEEPGRAAGAVRFLLNHVRVDTAARTTRGSIPAMLFGDGSAAAPEVFLDTGATAWALAAALEVQRADASLLSERADERPLAAIVSAAGNMLARWSSVGGRAYPTFDPVLGRDALRFEGQLELALGLAAALQFGTATPSEAEHWRKALDAITKRSLSGALADRNAAARRATYVPAVAYWIKRVLPSGHPLLQVAMDPLDESDIIARTSLPSELGQPFGPVAEAAIRVLRAGRLLGIER